MRVAIPARERSDGVARQVRVSATASLHSLHLVALRAPIEVQGNSAANPASASFFAAPPQASAASDDDASLD